MATVDTSDKQCRKRVYDKMQMKDVVKVSWIPKNVIKSYNVLYESVVSEEQLAKKMLGKHLCL